MPNQPKPENVPICFRPGTKPGDPDGDRAWLHKYHEETRKPVGEIVSEAVVLYRAVSEGRITTTESRTTTGITTPVAAKPPRPRAGRKTEVKSGSEDECQHPGVRPKNRCPKCGRYNI